jgi:DNA polymerase
MDSTADDELADELRDLTRQLRGQLLRHAALGAWAAPGGDTTRAPEDAASALEASQVSAWRDAPAPDPDAARRWSDAGAQASDAVPIVARDLDAPVMARDPGAPVRLGKQTLPQIRAELGDCTRCKLHTTRRSIVFGVGAADAPLMFVGEAPGEQEDRRGEPFVGAAGELLDKMIEAMGWTRGAVYIANTTKCRPPGNRNPQPDELEQCIPFLHAQIASVAPRIIVALGRPASNQLLGVDAPISSLRGRFHDYARASDRNGLKIMPTFHPAYLLRDPDKKRAAWSDLKLVMAELTRLGIAPPSAA